MSGQAEVTTPVVKAVRWSTPSIASTSDSSTVRGARSFMIWREQRAPVVRDRHRMGAHAVAGGAECFFTNGKESCRDHL